jgi:hypothetical protein
MASHTLYNRIHKAALMKEISIYRGHKEAIIIAMILSDIYNPKKDMTVRNAADLE